MRLVIQRVRNASVTAENYHEKIGHGLFILLGVKEGDTKENDIRTAEKLYKMRVMSDVQGKMNRSVSDVSGEFLVVSQFTRYANSSGGNRPSFVKAAKSEHALKIYDLFCAMLEDLGGKVKRGSFGNY